VDVMMFKVFINRLDYGPNSTLGHVLVYFGLTKVFECWSLELPWKDNQRKISCIPEGDYVCKHRGSFGHFPYDHYQVQDVPGRDGILIHRGNFTSDIEGCILVGTSFKDLNRDGKTDLENSKITLQRLYEIIGDEDFKLIIHG
jgi:hypothetical protein